MRTEAKFLITTEPSKENCPRNQIDSWIERGEFLCTEWAFCKCSLREMASRPIQLEVQFTLTKFDLARCYFEVRARES